jgi:drug/metabolite transporter (DMT)-like permease
MLNPLAGGWRLLGAPALMLSSSALFALMGACVKAASPQYGTGEIVMYRSLFGVCFMAVLLRRRGSTLRTPVPWMHAWRSTLGVAALCLWLTAIGGLPLGTAMTLNAMSSVWMAAFIVALALLPGRPRGIVEAPLVAAVLVGFAGVSLLLRPTLGGGQGWAALAGLMSGVGAALAYLQVVALGRAGEPEERVVFYFSATGIAAGLLLALPGGGLNPHTPAGIALLLTIGLSATIAQLLMTRAFALGHPLVNGVLQYSSIAFSVGLGVWWFGDPLDAQTVLGMLLIVGAGVAATRLRSR